MDLLAIRQRDARQKSAFYAGETEYHPHGSSGAEVLLPYENDKSCSDAVYPRNSSWGKAAGFY